MRRIKCLAGGGKTRIWRLALLLYLCMVYGHSMMPAHISSGESGAVLGLLQRGMEFIGLNGAMLTEHIVRKTAHFTEYMGVGILLWGNFAAGGLRSADRVALAMVVIPFVDETIQLFVAGRSGQISDVWLDMAGAAAGLLAAWFVSRWKKRSRDEL